jgi:hypothetical protein
MRYFLDIKCNKLSDTISKFEIYDNKINVLYQGYQKIGDNQEFIKIKIDHMIPISDHQAESFTQLGFYDLAFKKANEFLKENNLEEWII